MAGEKIKEESSYLNQVFDMETTEEKQAASDRAKKKAAEESAKKKAEEVAKTQGQNLNKPIKPPEDSKPSWEEYINKLPESEQRKIGMMSHDDRMEYKAKAGY